MTNNERNVHDEMKEMGLLIEEAEQNARTREALLTRIDEENKDAYTFKLVAVGSTENPEDGEVTIWQMHLDREPDEIFISLSDDYRVLRVKGIKNPDINDNEIWKREFGLTVEGDYIRDITV